MVNTKSIGEISEAVAIAEFLKAGFPVLLPFGDNRRYDMVVEVGGQFLRVQCKTARPVHGGAVLCFKTRSGAFGPGDRVTSRARSYRNEADLFAAYAPSTGQVYVLAVDNVPESEVWLRLTPTKNHQQARIRYAEEHTLAVWATSVRAPTNGSIASSGAPMPIHSSTAGRPRTGADRDAQRCWPTVARSGTPVMKHGHSGQRNP